VIGIDNLNSYYDPALKRARLAEVEAVAAAPGAGSWRFEAGDLSRSLLRMPTP